ncbi:hypothetical protein EJ06DRAFT_527593 [Trichodelitschia bisporula]|uniref:Uncharacterized protein n=1 Tax=Trichodelitschia bisporula TaxID=703511 RepID=A0A6G1I6V2_9PEZI|nr:hypothetical protein EJ06DRAFT_527593 [Trichodelitschia bisporula]
MPPCLSWVSRTRGTGLGNGGVLGYSSASLGDVSSLEARGETPSPFLSLSPPGIGKPIQPSMNCKSAAVRLIGYPVEVSDLESRISTLEAKRQLDQHQSRNLELERPSNHPIQYKPSRFTRLHHQLASPHSPAARLSRTVPLHSPLMYLPIHPPPAAFKQLAQKHQKTPIPVLQRLGPPSHPATIDTRDWRPPRPAGFWRDVASQPIAPLALAPCSCASSFNAG